MWPTVDRDQVRDLLLSWRCGTLRTEDVFFRAEEILDGLEYNQTEMTESVEEYFAGDESIPLQVLNLLNCMSYDPIVEDDIPFLLKFLNAEKGHAADANRELDLFLSKIDFVQRRKALADHPFYGEALKHLRGES